MATFSPVTLGLWAMGGKYWGEDVRDEDSIAAIHAALDLGIESFDTAPLYGEGHADELLVRALGERRHQVTIATKVGVRLPTAAGEHARSDLSPAHLRADCEASLRRLKLERIDLLQIHWPCEFGTPLEESLATLVALQGEGKIAAFGLSNYDAPTLARARQLAPVATLQTPYSLLRREYEQGLEAVCLEPAPALGVLIYEPLCRGLLTAKFDEESTFPDSDLRAHDDRFSGPAFRRALRLAEGLARIAEHFDATAAALAIAWVLRRPSVSAALVGAKRPEQVRQNAEAARLAADPGVPWEVLDRMAEAMRPPPRHRP
ncbi:MAG: aldo/keto reductase [Deltaproteobacteria bacterium]|nr:aldo/keto reductase [Deltaproteobacteria bacterium]